MVEVQALRAYLFEAHEEIHRANSSKIVEHLHMANEDVSRDLQNLTTGQLPENENGTLSSTLQDLQMQLNNTISLADAGNMAEVMANLMQADEQLAALLPTLGFEEGESGEGAAGGEGG